MYVGILYVCIYVAIYEAIRGWGKPKAEYLSSCCIALFWAPLISFSASGSTENEITVVYTMDLLSWLPIQQVILLWRNCHTCDCFYTAQCRIRCVYGTCVGPNVCSCHPGWQGARCDRGIYRTNCKFHARPYIIVHCLFTMYSWVFTTLSQRWHLHNKWFLHLSFRIYWTSVWLSYPVSYSTTIVFTFTIHFINNNNNNNE